jgi:hypothetical protein
MKEPPRLLDEMTGLDRAVLEAARADEPSPVQRRRVLAALGAAGATGFSTSAASASLLAKLGALGSAKVFIGLVVVGSGVGWTLLHRDAPKSAPATVVVVTTSFATSAVSPTVGFPPTQATQDVATAVSEIVPAPQVTSVASVAPKKPPKIAKAILAPPVLEASSFTRELGLIDEARLSLAAHQAGKALAALDRRDVEFPTGALALEARVLRVEALAAAGDGKSASAIAADFLERHPGSIYEARLLKYVAEKSP